MKKLFVALLAVAGLTACFNEEVVRVQDPTAISFEANWVENATRANEAQDPSTTTESLTGFNVWGFIDSPEGKVFEAEDVTGTQGNFTYVNTQYWLPGHKYYFAALAPMDSANVEVDTTKASIEGLGVVTFENINGTEDLIYAANVEEAPELGQEAQPVKFTFNHLLSKVKFSFTNGFNNDLAYIDVKNIKMVVPSQASINLAQADWWSTNQWKLIDAVPTILEFGDACAKTAAGVKQVSANERLTIPADATQAYKVTFDVVLYFGDVVAFEKTLESNIEGVALEIGKAYNFTATLDHTNISGEDDVKLQPIVFDVEEVKDWVEAGDQNLAVDGYITNLVLTEDYAAGEMVKLAGNLNGNGHTLSAVAGVNYVVNNTARLIETTGDATIENVKIDGKGVYTDKYGIRGIYTIGTGDVTVKNVEIINCTYAINANNAGKITVLNSTLQGWNSYGSTTEAYFENVKFIDGTYHNFRPYNNTVCKNCDFGAGVVIDLSQMVDGATIKFENCTYDGVALTAANLSDAEGVNVAIDLVVTEAPESNALVGNSSVANMTIDGGNYKTTDGKGLRGIYITAGGEYTVDNVVVKNVTYAINVNTLADVKLDVTNSTLEGWTSFGGSTTATFTNVKFECGTYANFKPYTSTTLTDCSFEAGFQIDLSSLTGVITLKNCTYAGTVLTAENIASVANIDSYDAAKFAF